MTIAILLIPYALFLLFFLFFSCAALLHIIQFGIKNFTTFLATFVFIAVAVILLQLSWTSLNVIDWATPLFEGLSITLPA